MKEELEKYNDYIADIKKIDRDIAKLKREEVAIGGSNFEINGDIKPKGYMANTIEKKIINNADKIRDLELQKAEKQAQLNYIDSLLNTLKYDERNLLKMYYIERKNILRISKEIQKTEKTIFRKLKKSLEKIEKKYQEK